MPRKKIITLMLTQLTYSDEKFHCTTNSNNEDLFLIDMQEKGSIWVVASSRLPRRLRGRFSQYIKKKVTRAFFTLIFHKTNFHVISPEIKPPQRHHTHNISEGYVQSFCLYVYMWISISSLNLNCTLYFSRYIQVFAVGNTTTSSETLSTFNAE